MAVVNFYDDIFDNVTETITIDNGNLRELMETHIENRPDKVLQEVYNAKTGETEFVDLQIQSYKAVVIVNGEESLIDYEIQPDDIISVMFIPQSPEAEKGWGVALQVSGWIGTVVGGIMTFTPLAGVGQIIMAVGQAQVAIGTAMYADGESKLKTAQEAKDRGTSLPYIDGASNQNQTGNRYLTVLGKHLISPNIVGSPYHETHVKDYSSQEDGGQWIKVLYCAGYGPLRLTNFKLGEQILSYNESNGSGDRDTVMHGQLNTYDYYEKTKNGNVFHPGDFTVKWKNNDVKMEILQAGSYVDNWNVSDKNNDIYGTIYPQSVIESKINADILFAYDKALSELAPETPPVLYFNKSIPSGYRTNTVRMSANCPEKIQVELDAPNGLFETYDAANKVWYKKIPVFVAVQWRFMKESNNAPNAESAAGWETFDGMLYDNRDMVRPVTYTDQSRIIELAANRGVSESSSRDYNSDWIGAQVFELSGVSSGTYWQDLTAEEILHEQQAGNLRVTEKTPVAVQRVPEGNYPYVGERKIPLKKPSESYPYTVTSEEISKFYEYEVVNDKNGSFAVDQTTNKPQYKIIVPNNTPAVSKENFNYKERRFVFEKTFTDEDIKKMVNHETGETYYDQIEVRVIRLTPCYLPESYKSKVASGSEYQDLIKWNYLRTYKFDKQTVVEKLKTLKPGEAFVKNEIISRPQPIKTDLDDFVYIALSMKQDINESVESTIQAFSCIAESFVPKYDIDSRKWYPEVKDVKQAYRYFHKYQDDNGEWIIDDTVTEAQYKENVKKDQIGWYKRSKGNNFADLIRGEIFGSGDHIKGVKPLMKAILPEPLKRKYISSNTASVFALSLMGKHLNEDAKTYDAINMSALTEFYRFCEDITDGTKDNSALRPALVSSINFTAPERKIAGTVMDKNGYPGFKDAGSFATVYLGVHYSAKDLKATVFTPIKNDGTLITYTKFNEYKNAQTFSYTEGQLAVFEGENCLVAADKYCTVLNAIQKFYYNAPLTSPWNDDIYHRAMNVVRDLIKIPVNALRRGIAADTVNTLVEYIAEDNKTKADYSLSSYVIDVLEQTLQEGNTVNLVGKYDGQTHFKFECNGVLSREVKLETLLSKILLTGRAYLKRSDDNKYEPYAGKEEPYAVNVINQRNCIARSNSRSYDELPSGFQVSLIDRDDNYGTNDFYVMAPGEDYKNPSARIEPFNIEYVTDKNQLACLARFNLACRLYQLESYSRTVGMVGHSLSLGEVVLIQDDTLLIGTDNSGRIIEIIEDNNKIYGFTTDEPFNYKGEADDNGKCTQGCTVIQPQFNGNSRTVTLRFALPSYGVQNGSLKLSMKRGLTNLILLETPINKTTELTAQQIDGGDFYFVHPEVDNLVAFGNVGSITSKAVIMGIKPKEGDKFDLTLVPYNEELYKAGNSFPIFSNNMTNPEASNFDFNFNPSFQEMKEQSVEATNVSINYTDFKIAQTEAKIVKSVNAVPEIYASPANLGFSTNKSNITPVKQTIKTVLHVIQFGTESSFELKNDWEDSLPEGFTATWDGLTHELTLTVDQDKRVVAQNIMIPVQYHSFKDRYWYGNDTTGIEGAVPVQTRLVETRYELLTAKPYNWDSTYGTYFILDGEGEDALVIQNINNEWKEKTYYRLIINGNYGGFVIEDDPITRFVELAVVPVQGGRYLGAIKSLDDLKAKKVEWAKENVGLLIGDYITWVGDSGTSGPVKDEDKDESGKFYKFKTYQYVGKIQGKDYEWTADIDRSHVAECYNDIIKSAEDALEIAETNPSAYNYFKDLYASSVIAKEIVANDAFIKNLFATEITITQLKDKDGQVIGGGSIRSSNFNGDDDNKSNFTKGFCLDHDGNMYAANADIRGKITAEELYIGKNHTKADTWISNEVDNNITDKNKGTWNSSKTYRKGDNVYYATTGSTYVCIKDADGTKLPTNTEYWVLVASKGDNIKSTGSTIQYALSDDGSTPPKEGWQDTAPERTKNFLWTRVTTGWSLGEPTDSYTVTSTGNLTLELSNDMDSIPMTTAEKVARDINLTTTANLYNGSTKIGIKSITVTGAEYSVSGGEITLTIKKDTAFTNKQIEIKITVEGEGNIGVREKKFIVYGISGTAMYTLVPSTAAVTVSKTGAANPATITCKIIKTEENASPVEVDASQCPSGYTFKCKVDDVEKPYTKDGITVQAANKNVEFEFYKETTLIDKETVPLIYDGKDGQPGANAPTISVVRPIYAFVKSGQPTQPTATTVISDSQVNTENTWSYVRPEFAGDRKFWISFRTEYSNKHVSCSTMTSDVSYDTLGGSVSNYQKIYYRSTQKVGQITVPTTRNEWETTDTEVNDNWTTHKMAATDKYPYVFSCTQYRTLGGTVQNTTVAIDTETVIDTENGFIKTNLIDVDNLLTRKATIKEKGEIVSANYGVQTEQVPVRIEYFVKDNVWSSHFYRTTLGTNPRWEAVKMRIFNNYLHPTHYETITSGFGQTISYCYSNVDDESKISDSEWIYFSGPQDIDLKDGPCSFDAITNPEIARYTFLYIKYTDASGIRIFRTVREWTNTVDSGFQIKANGDAIFNNGAFGGSLVTTKGIGVNEILTFTNSPYSEMFLLIDGKYTQHHYNTGRYEIIYPYLVSGTLDVYIKSDFHFVINFSCLAKKTNIYTSFYEIELYGLISYGVFNGTVVTNVTSKVTFQRETAIFREDNTPIISGEPKCYIYSYTNDNIVSTTMNGVSEKFSGFIIT